MREEKVIAIIVVVFLFLGVFIALSSCSGSGSTYYHIPGTDTRKSKTHKPKSGWSIPKTSGGGFRKR